jgi:CheY-like chemotaxis protein
VVVSDWLMPGLDGVQLCRRIREPIEAPYTYFVLLTALADAEHRMAGIQAGADDYLAKPFSLEDVEVRLIAAERVTAAHRRQEALLRIYRRFAAEPDAGHLVHELLHEAINLIGGTAGVVTRWDEELQMLVPVSASLPVPESSRVRLGEGASGRAAQMRAPVSLNRDNGGAIEPILSRMRLDSAVAVPLVYGARLVGTLAVGAAATETHGQVGFTPQDVELLELLARTAAAALVALERARLEGVLLAARTAQHELNNHLAVARGYAELLVGAPDLPPNLHQIAGEVISAADDAARVVRELRNIARIREQRWNAPGDTTINLARSQRRRGVA